MIRTRFCSRQCYFSAKIIAEAAKRIRLACVFCNIAFTKAPKRVGAMNYCSNACSRADHGRKITGKNHPNWRGGSLNSRGPSWKTCRHEVLERQGFHCFDCQMTDSDHRLRYKVGLHVHHKSPYRLTLTNSTDNLVAVCIPCHGREESATRRQLSPQDFETMQRATRNARKTGLDRDDYARAYNMCNCGHRKAKRALLCRRCRNAATFQASTHIRCICGGRKSFKALACWTCHLKSRRATP